MKTFRILGGLLALYGAVMLVLLATPAKQWALEHSIAHLVSRTDRRVNNTVDGAVDMPLALAGSAVLLFAGAWFGLFVPRVFRKHEGAMRSMIEANMAGSATSSVARGKSRAPSLSPTPTRPAGMVTLTFCRREARSVTWTRRERGRAGAVRTRVASASSASIRRPPSSAVIWRLSISLRMRMRSSLVDMAVPFARR